MATNPSKRQASTFGDLHEGAYLAHGFKLIHIDSAPAVQRVESIKRYVEGLRETNVPFPGIDSA
jgi:hypothetical protein